MEKNHFVIIITAYNCDEWIVRCLNSALSQIDYGTYTWEIFCVNAASTDKTEQIIASYNVSQKIRIFHNPKRCFQTENIFRTTARMAKYRSIIVSLDGDDWLKHKDVLMRLNEVYRDPDVWMTYGRYEHSNGLPIPGGTHYRYPDQVIAANSFREYPKQLFTHLRTWRRELMMKISPDDLKVNGEFARNAGDCFIGYPMLEMAGQHQAFIDEVLYVYNIENPLQDGKVAPQEQQDLAAYAKALPKYQPLEKLY